MRKWTLELHLKQALRLDSMTDGNELTGVCGSKQLNVVPVTLEERSNTTVPLDWYVLEQANIDGIVLWQDKSGAVYQTAPHIKPRKLCGSLAEYIEL